MDMDVANILIQEEKAKTMSKAGIKTVFKQFSLKISNLMEVSSTVLRAGLISQYI
jgi:hypothetical protein